MGKFTVDDIRNFISPFAQVGNTDRIPADKSRIIGPITSAAYNTLVAANNDLPNVLYAISG